MKICKCLTLEGLKFTTTKKDQTRQLKHALFFEICMRFSLYCKASERQTVHI